MTTTTVHVAKWHCFKISRPLMERQWDPGRVVFLGLAEPGWEPTAARWGVDYEPLGFPAVRRWARSADTRMVFHGQPSLPYLLCALLAGGPRKTGAELLYDIHDLHVRATGGVAGVPRWLALGFMEWFCLRLARVRSITVSPGLASEVARRYGCPAPALCYNIPPPATARSAPAGGPRSGIVYFGQLENYRLSEDRLDALAKEGLSMDVYGRLVPQHHAHFDMLKRYEERGVIRLRGEYAPDNLDFLDSYEAVLIDYGVSCSLNIRHCLPNKLFLALRHGLTAIVSPNLEDAAALFQSVPGAVAPLAPGRSIAEIVRQARAMRPADYDERINRRLDQLRAESKAEYLGTGCDTQSAGAAT